jgi:hypothetical protein
LAEDTAVIRENAISAWLKSQGPSLTGSFSQIPEEGPHQEHREYKEGEESVHGIPERVRMHTDEGIEQGRNGAGEKIPRIMRALMDG